jgi:Transposase IS66 family
MLRHRCGTCWLRRWMRNESWRGLAAELREENGRLREGNALLRAENAEQAAELGKLRADLAVLQRMVFGRPSERSRPEPPGGAAAAPAPRDKTAAAARLDDAQAAWNAAITAINQARKKQMAAPGLPDPAKKALATLDREWDSLAAHRDYPMIGLDNNAAERMIRGPS